MPPNDQAFPPAPIGGSYESFDNEFQAESPSEGEDLSTPNSEPKEKDGFDFDEDNDVFDKGNDADDEKTMLHDLSPRSNVDFELPQDALDLTLHDDYRTIPKYLVVTDIGDTFLLYTSDAAMICSV